MIQSDTIKNRKIMYNFKVVSNFWLSLDTYFQFYFFKLPVPQLKITDSTSRFNLLWLLLNSFQSSVAIHIKTTHLFCSAKQITGSFMKANTGVRRHIYTQLNMRNVNLIFLGGWIFSCDVSLWHYWHNVFSCKIIKTKCIPF